MKPPKLGSVWSYVGSGTDKNHQPKIITIRLIAKDSDGRYELENLIGKSLANTLGAWQIMKTLWHQEDPNDIKGSAHWRAIRDED